MLVDYTLEGNRPVVHTWRRQNKRRVREEHRNFDPYFFVHEDERIPQDDRIKTVKTGGDWKSNKGHPLKKIVAYNPKQVGGYGGLRDEFTQTWESDVYFRTRYWLDEVGNDDIPNTQYRICMYDIEVDHSLDAKTAPEEITSITAYDNYLEKYVSFVLAPPTQQTDTLSNGRQIEGQKNGEWSVYVFDDEREMLLRFLDFIKDTDPDIISAWNGETYDDPYLFNRCRQLRIDYSEFSPINRVDFIDDGERVKMKGRELIDMIPALKKSYFSELDSYRLNDVGANLLGLEKITFEGTGAQLWRDDPEKLAEYNKRDVEIMVQLNEKFDIWGMLKEVQQWVGINMSDILHNSRVTQAYFMRKMDARMPPKGWSEGDDPSSFEGATVLEETPGVSRNVAVLDLKAQYPSSMISYNMSPEMKIDDDMGLEDIVGRFIEPDESDMSDEEFKEKFGYSKESIRDNIEDILDEFTIKVGTGAEFWYGEMGAVPRVLIEMIQERDKHKELRDEAEPGSQIYEAHDRRQFALKFVINSVYGVMGFQDFMLYDRDVAASTTFVGRETIEWAVDAARDLGYEVVYGDTDSVMISMGEDVSEETAVDKAKKLEDYINETYDEYAEDNDIDTSRFDGVDRTHFFEIEVEKLYETFFMSNAKKKYAGKIVWKEGKWIDDYDFAQFGKRSSMSQLSRDIQEDLLKLILDGGDMMDARDYITEICNKMKDEEYNLDYIGIPSRMKKEMDEYKTDRPILRATKHTNEFLDEEFGKGDKPKYIYVRATPPGRPETDVVAFSQQDIPDNYLIDWDTMVQKNVRQKVKRIITVMDWDWRSLYRTTGSLLDI